MDQEFDIAWDIKASEKLKEIYTYLKDSYSEKYAKRISNEIFSKIDGLRSQPERYPPESLLSHRPENFRFIIINRYKVVIYEFTGSELYILYIHNTKQHPDNLEDAIA